MHLCQKVAHICRRSAPLLKQRHRCLPQNSANKSGQCCTTRGFISSTHNRASIPTRISATDNTQSFKRDSNSLEIPEPELDFEYLCDPQNRDEIQQNVVHRKGVGDIDKVLKLWKELQRDTAEVEIRDYLQDRENDVTDLRRRLFEEASHIPNRTHPDVPIGDETKNRFVEQVGERREFTFEPKAADKLGEALGMQRTQNLGITTGKRTYYLTDGFAKLEQALIRYTVDRLVGQGFELMSVPDLVHPAIVEGCGFQIRDERTQIYKLAQRHGNIMLAGTGEIPIAGNFMNARFTEDELPKKVCTVSRCYRAEAEESAGQGLYRVHQFTKVEMFVLCDKLRDGMLEEIIHIQRDLFAELGLHFRVLDMASHELGAPAYRKYDLEAWLPAPEFWGEISSASNCTDFQSRRLNIKYFDKSGNVGHVHTLNGTACAIPRTIIALVENNQNQDGSVNIPPVLQPYMDGLKKLVKSTAAPKYKWIRYIRQRDS